MKVLIIRHGKVNFNWKAWSTSEQFNEDCKMYDKAPIFPSVFEISWDDYQNIYISSLQRSRETANQIFEGKDFIIVTHGFFMHSLINVMKKNAFCISHTRLRYSNGECIVAER